LLPSFNLYSSNRLEILAGKLSELLKRDPLAPLEREVVVVQSRGMQRWLSLELARHLGICANMWFPFPNAVVNRLFQAAFPDLPDESPWDPDVMTWTLIGMVPAWLAKPGFEAVKAYVGESPHSLKIYQLCLRIASTFDQYLTFRPDMLLEWEKGNDNHWQAALWRGLRSRYTAPHRAGLREAFLERIRSGALTDARFPKRISVFGISTLPHFHIEILGAAALVTEIHLFLMNPCEEYWLDIVSQRTLARMGDHIEDSGWVPEPLHFETGNSLLSSLGTLGREFFSLIGRLDPFEHEYFQGPETVDLLSWIQHDILTLYDRGRDPCERQAISAGDTSIRIHSCHSPLRELEILKDQLLAFFEEDDDLSPGDILVMTPDIEAYAPFIEAVFSDVDHPRVRIPFSIADRSLKGESRFLEDFLWLLDLKESRFAAPEVMDLLECPAVMERFGISESDLPVIREWVVDAGIRWGISGEHKAEMGLPPFPQNTWRAGLSRLILGYAMSAGDPAFGVFHEISPCDRIEGRDGLVLGRFASFLEALFDHAASLEGERTLGQWSALLKQMLDRFFFAVGEDHQSGLLLRRAIDRLALLEQASGFHGKVAVQVIRAWLLQSLARDPRGLGFITGGVTFCAMLPMRSIPFKIICLLGMNSDAYPRRFVRPGFDLMAADPRPGDRSQRNDDRYLFLEAILSARKKLHISYVGQDPQDNSKIMPSVLVSELMDYMERGFALPGKAILEHILVRHPLQPFSPTYFIGGPPFFSYSDENCEAARAFLAPRMSHSPFISHGLDPSAFRQETIQLTELIRFYANPARFLLRHRLKIELASETPRLEDTEPFDLEGLNRYLLGERLVKGRLSGFKQDAILDAAKASEVLPHGTVGLCAREEIQMETERFIRLLDPWIGAGPLGPLQLETQVAGIRVVGRLTNRFAPGLVQYRFTKIKARDLLKLWLSHLVYNRCAPDGSDKRSLLLGKDEGFTFDPLPHDDNYLEGLILIFEKGLVKPVHFFPETSLAFARAIIERNSSQEAAMGAARRVWQGDGEYWAGESDNAYYRRCFEGQDPLDNEFREFALTVFEPLFALRRPLSIAPSASASEGP
jgi:exodeoxyribonuclease V gamma subunit